MARCRAVSASAVLVLQGGGALGAYQAGVYQALHEAGIEPDWVIGTSIGAINAALIAGNEPADRLARSRNSGPRGARRCSALLAVAVFGPLVANMLTVIGGIPAFFPPNPLAFLGPHVPLGAGRAGYYDTAPLRETLGELVDFELHQPQASRG